jgi:O-antigen ligase
MNKQLLRNIIFIGLFAVPFIPFLVSSTFFFPFISTKAFAWRIIIEIVFAAWLLLALLEPHYRPRKSVISIAILGFLLIIGLADLLGVAPLKSFWSNFERMEGFISLLHLGMFFLVISSVFEETDWKRWWNVSLGASFAMVLYCVLQIIGLKTINQGGVRVDGTLGNAIYLAVYMLFHIFIALLFLWQKWKSHSLRWIYGLLILSQITILYNTATRGAILGLVGGVLVMAILNLRNREAKIVRKASMATLVGLVILIGGFVVIKDSEFIKKSPVLYRFSSLTTAELKTQGRYFVWPMALEGAKERPLLGWGQENFNYIFQEHYSPEMFRLEPWFDRAHNIFLDWTVSGGIIGLLSYLTLYLALLFSIWRQESKLSHTEKSILTGLVAAYFFHNFFVFDHLISYILFFSLLSYIHAHGHGQKSLERGMAPVQVRNIALPIVSVLLILSLYFVNIKPIKANVSLIEAFKSLQTPGQTKTTIEHFQKAYRSAPLGRPEVIEHLTNNAPAILSSDLTPEEKNAFFVFTKEAMLEQTEKMKDDARFELVAGSFFSAAGFPDEGLAHLERAKALIPGKQAVYFEIGATYINKGEAKKALEVFREALELAPEYLEAQKIYLIGAIYAADREVESEMTSKLTEKDIAFDDRILNAYYATGQVERVKSLLEARIKLDPANEATYREYLTKIEAAVAK